MLDRLLETLAAVQPIPGEEWKSDAWRHFVGVEPRKTKREGAMRRTGRWIASVWVGDACMTAARGSTRSGLKKWANKQATRWKGSYVRIGHHDSKRWRPVPKWQSSPLAWTLIGSAIRMFLTVGAVRTIPATEEATVP